MVVAVATIIAILNPISGNSYWIKAAAAYSTALGHLFHEHVASHSMTCGHPREVICEAVYS
jgi:hypothetical protein